MVFCYYFLKYSSNDYSYLKQSPFSIFACLINFLFRSDILLGGGPRFVTVCDRGEEGGQKSSKKA